MMREFRFWVNCHFEEQDVMLRLETYSRQNTRMCWINEESHRNKSFNINILKSHVLCVFYSVSLSKRIIHLFIVYVGHLEFFLSSNIEKLLFAKNLINKQIM